MAIIYKDSLLFYCSHSTRKDNNNIFWRFVLLFVVISSFGNGRIIPPSEVLAEMDRLFKVAAGRTSPWSSVKSGSGSNEDPFSMPSHPTKRNKRSPLSFESVLNPFPVLGGGQTNDGIDSRGNRGTFPPLLSEREVTTVPQIPSNETDTGGDRRRQLLIYNPLSGGMSYLPTQSFYNTQSFPLSPYGTLGAGGLGTFPPFSASNFGGNTLINPYAIAGNTGVTWPGQFMPGGMMGIGGGMPFGSFPGQMSPFFNPNIFNPTFNPNFIPNQNPIGPLIAANMALRFNQAQFYNNVPLARSGTSYSPNIMTSLAASQMAGTNIAAAASVGGTGGGGLGRFGEIGSIGIRPAVPFGPSSGIFTGYGAGNGLGFNFYPGMG